MDSHSLSDITTTVKTKLDNKLNRTDEAASVQWNNVSNRPSSYNPTAHRHNWNEIDNKPAIPGSPRAYITETWRSGGNWFRKYNDGFIEQGGNLSVNITVGGYRSANTTLSFNTPFSSNTYTITSYDNGEHVSTSCYSRSTSSAVFQCTARANNSYNTNNIIWYAAGY